MALRPVLAPGLRAEWDGVQPLSPIALYDLPFAICELASTRKPVRLLTGIFVRIAAETAEEDLRNGKKRITPYWRVIKKDGSLNPKFPGGVKSQAARLREEGHKIVAGGDKNPPKVQDFEKALA